MSKKLFLSIFLIMGLVSIGYCDVIGDFEDAGLDGWWSNSGTISQTAAGVTLGSSAMQVDITGMVPPDNTWRMAAQVDAKSQMAALGSGADIGGTATISADITISATGIDGTWANSEVIINAQNNDDNGANNNLGWNGLGGQDLVLDGASYTYQWTLTPALRDAIAGADSGIGWFEIVIATNSDSNSISFQIDNVQVNAPATDVVVGNFEDAGLDGWTSDGTISQGTTGVTLDSSSLKIEANGGWQAVGKLDAKPYMALMGSGVLLSADITVIDADAVGATWMNAEMIINGQGDNGYTIGWNPLGGQDLVRDGEPHTYVWSISSFLTDAIAATDQGIGWFEIFLVANNDASSITMYVDNVRISQPEPVDNPPKGVVVGDFETGLEGWWTNAGESTITQGTIGATSGSGALQVEDAGDWRICGRVDAKLYIPILGSEGAKVTLDVTAFPADLPDNWLNVGAVINGENGNGYTIGWRDMGQQPVTINGQPQTLEFLLPADLIADISQADDGIGWFELVITKNSGAGKFYIDNVMVFPAPEPIDFTYGVLIGNFETGFDGWGGWDGQRTQTEIGATRDSMAMRSEVASGWHGHAQLEAKPLLEMFGAGARLVADITTFPEDYNGGWGNIEMILNCQNNNDNGANNNIGWRSLGTKDPVRDGKPHTYEWVLSDSLRAQIAGADQNISWFQLVFVTNSDSASQIYYIDNIWVYIPATAGYPTPVNGGTEVEIESTLTWTGGGGAVQHELYFGEDAADVDAATSDDLGSYPDVIYTLLDEASWETPRLKLDTTYFWRVDTLTEADDDPNDIIVTKGDVWSFTTANYIVLEDFESYADGDELRAVWVDANDLSSEIAHLGSQSVKLTANNLKSPYHVEATRTFGEGEGDFTEGGVAVLEVYFRGDPNNLGEQLYIRLQDGDGNSAVVLYKGDLNDVTVEEWTNWKMALDDFEGVNLADVASISLGSGDPDGAAPSGALWALFVDDIRLYQARCILDLRGEEFARIDFAPVGLPLSGDCVVDIQELSILVSDWLKTDSILPASVVDPNLNGGGRLAYYELDEGFGDTVTGVEDSNSLRTGTLYNNATWVTPGYDGTGSAVHFDGSGDSRIDLGTWDPSEGTGELTLSAWIRWEGAQSPDHQGIIGKRSNWAATDAMRWFLETQPNGSLQFRQYWEAGVDLNSGPGVLDPFIGKWVHVAVSFDGTTAAVYLNGAEVASGPFVLGDMADAALGIGSTHGTGGGEIFVGDIDEVQIYNRALSAEDIAYMADMTPGDGQLAVPIASRADISSDEPAGQKSINLSDLAVLSEYWLSRDIALDF